MRFKTASASSQARVSRQLQRLIAGMSSEAAVVEGNMSARSRYRNKSIQHCFVARMKARSKVMKTTADDHIMQTRC